MVLGVDEDSLEPYFFCVQAGGWWHLSSYLLTSPYMLVSCFGTGTAAREVFGPDLLCPRGHFGHCPTWAVVETACVGGTRPASEAACF